MGSSSDPVVLEALTRHLAACPPVVLEAARPRAVWFDLFQGAATPPWTAELLGLLPKDEKGDQAQITLVLAWLLSAPELRPWPAPNGLRLLLELPPALAPLVTAAGLITDPDRREELARLVLSGLQRLPAGETAVQAADRLRSISSVERERVIRETQAQVERARKLKEELRRKQAEAEAASRWGGE